MTVLKYIEKILIFTPNMLLIIPLVQVHDILYIQCTMYIKWQMQSKDMD